MSKLNHLKKTMLGHENIEFADVLQALLLIGLIALLLFIALKLKRII